MNIIQSTLTRNPCYTAGRKIAVQYLILHSVGCAQPSAEVFVGRWNNEEYDRACVHAFIDANNGDIYQTLPWNHRAWHSGGSANNYSIGVEMCESSFLRYIGVSDRFTVTNKEKAWAHCQTAYKSAVELFAYLCQKYNLSPTRHILSHNEAAKKGIASGHSDPEHYWKQLGIGYTMAGFREDVKNAMGGEITITNTEVEEDMGLPTLKQGANGDAVKVLQKLLVASGYDCGKAGIDGDFGSGTLSAVKKFQSDNKLSPDGVVGEKTWAALGVAPILSYDKTEYNALYASADALVTRIKNAIEIYEKGA